jgi:DnaJ family protein B protein 12
MSRQVTYPSIKPQSQSKPSFPPQSFTRYQNPTAQDENGLFVPQSSTAGSQNNSSSLRPNTRSTFQKASIDRILACDRNQWYDILGVNDTCSTEEANKAYKRLALEVHPDKNKQEGATEAFKGKLKGYSPFATLSANSRKWSRKPPRL